ncbi:MAG: cyclic pyranopterin monophosphate synthase MoaC [Bacteroidales bacterium]|nr:cyclic pyranopterin monophosphate synthase MoaC [Bacteroidales bacterium]
MENQFSHIDNDGNAQMVNVGHKEVLLRKAIAKGSIMLRPETIQQIKNFNIKKGDVLTVAKIAGIQAAKQTAHIIPLCHPISFHYANIDFDIKQNSIEVTSTIECYAKTGVEMEALTAVSTALLTIYDMCKAVDKNMIITDIHLIEKQKQQQ